MRQRAVGQTLATLLTDTEFCHQFFEEFRLGHFSCPQRR